MARLATISTATKRQHNCQTHIR